MKRTVGWMGLGCWDGKSRRIICGFILVVQRLPDARCRGGIAVQRTAQRQHTTGPVYTFFVLSRVVFKNLIDVALGALEKRGGDCFWEHVYCAGGDGVVQRVVPPSIVCFGRGTGLV